MRAMHLLLPAWGLLAHVACGGLTTYGKGVACDSADTACVPGSTTTDPGPGPGPNTGDEDCNDGRDNDADALVDCQDDDCDPVCDADGDGVLNEAKGGADCDDTNPAVYPGAQEICDRADNDCDGLVDDEDEDLELGMDDWWYLDNDEDGYGNSSAAIQACSADETRYSKDNGDCDDTDPDLSPGEPEVSCDGIDNDCDPGTSDEPDDDGDGVSACEDCDDSDGTRYPGATEICGDGVDSNCDGLDCADWIEDFEAGPPLAAEWSTSGNQPWSVQSSTRYEGSYGAASGSISHSQTSAMTVNLTYASTGSISFYYTTSTESGYDYLRFYVDGVQQSQWSGTVGWTLATYTVPAGSHTFQWSYSKDGSINTGSDKVWVDLITATGGTP
jgi:hypothetical protein